MAYNTCTEITEELIPREGIVVFDWDNTLKIYDSATRQISSRVEKASLQGWKRDKQCEMYIISAIYPSRINLETLLFEVKKLGLLELFSQEEDKLEVHAGKFARKGNIIICGYDKAEIFLQVSQGGLGKNSDAGGLSGGATDEVDSAHEKGKDLEDARSKSACNKDVVFFDDEEVNIVNFSSLVKNSRCFLVK